MEEEVPEVVDTDNVMETYLRLNTLLREFDLETNDWSSELREELNNPIKQNLLNRMNLHDDDNEFWKTLSSIDHAPDRSSNFNFRPELLNVHQLDNEMNILFSNVHIAKENSSMRMERLNAGFERVKETQQSTVDDVIKRIRREVGLTKIENRVNELKEQIVTLNNSLEDKKETIQRNNREKLLTAEELRVKYEQDVEERVRNLIATMEQKNKALTTLTSSNEKLKAKNSNLQTDLGKLLSDLEAEERTGNLEVSTAVDPVKRFRASIYRHANAKGTDTSLFGDITAGTITEAIISDSQKALEEAFQKQQELYRDLAGTEERVLGMRKELTALLQSEENKALERLKKVCDNLQVKIQSDEQRVKVMAALVNQMHRSEVESARRADVRKTVIALSTGKGKGKSSMVSAVHTRSRKLPAAALVEEELLRAEGDLWALWKEPDDTAAEKETLSMKLHRRMYAQYFASSLEAPVDVPSKSDSDEEQSSPKSSRKPARLASLPRKRRITPAQSGKIQRIIDMINRQHTKLSSLKAEDIKQILDYREFEEEALRPDSSASSHVSAGQSAKEALSLEVTADHTQLLPGGSGKASGDVSSSSSSSAANHPIGSSSVSGKYVEGTSRSPSSRSDMRPRTADSRDSHLRIPTTSALSDRDDADFYAQNYGIKLALEQLTTLMDVLTQGSSGNSKGKSTPQQQDGVVSIGEAKEHQTVEGLRANIQRLVSLIREHYFLSQNSKQVRKGLQKEVDEKLKECDNLRSELLQEIEGSHWPTATKAGQYEVEIEETKARLKELKKEVKQWEQRVSLKRTQNIRMSQVISSTSARRATAIATKNAAQEHRNRKRGAGVLTVPENTTATGMTSKPAVPPTTVLSQVSEERYSVANRRMSLIDDLSGIYDTAMSSIRAADRAIPYHTAEDVATVAAVLPVESGPTGTPSAVAPTSAAAVEEYGVCEKDADSTQP